MKNKFMSLALVLLFLANAICPAAYAYDVQVEDNPQSGTDVDVVVPPVDVGICGENVLWEFYESGLLRIYGTGAMYDFEYECDELPDVPSDPFNPFEEDILLMSGNNYPGYLPYAEQIKEVLLENGVSKIGKNAFQKFYNTEKITIPPSVVRIEDTTALRGSLYISDIDAWSAIEYPEGESMLIYGIDVYLNNELLTVLNVPEGLTKITSYMYQGWESIREIYIPDTVTLIEDNAFNGCSSLNSVYIPDSVTTIENGVFQECAIPVKINISSLEAWLKIDFTGYLSNYVRDRRDIYIGGKLLDKIEIPDGTTEIKNYAFAGLHSPSFVSIPESVTSIGNCAFSMCESLVSADIPDGITSIGYNVFDECSSLKSLYIPGSVVSVDSYAFYKCDSLENIYYSGTEDEWNLIKGDVLYRLDESGIAVHFVPSKQEIITKPVSAVSSTSAVLSGSIENAYGNATYEFVYWSEDNPDKQTVEAGSDFTAELTSLNPDTEYYCYAVANIGSGKFAGNTRVFRTVAEPVITEPEVTTNPAQSVSKTSAVLSGTAVGISGDVSYHFVYWSKNNSTTHIISASSGFKRTLKNLTPGTTYYYYAKATSRNGESYTGYAQTFTTTEDDNVQSITVSPSFVSLKKGETCQLYATVLPATADDRNLVWSSSDKSIATVDQNGKIKAGKSGTAVITATSEVNRIKARCNVLVSEETLNGTYNFSEWNMATNSSSFAVDGFDRNAVTRGGDFKKATAYLARWDGAVLESKDKYPAYYTNEYSKMYYEIDSDYHVQEVIWIPAREGHDDNDEIKRALMLYGAAYASMIWNASFYNEATAAYYIPQPGLITGGHAIAIVGWDDNYPAENFSQTPPGNGAFICKNSSGKDFGEDGYFYVSYYDEYIGIRNGGCAVFNSLESNTNYNTIYQYDPLGPTDTFGYTNATYAANVFPRNGESLSNDELLRAVSFYTYNKNTCYDIFVVPEYTSPADLENYTASVASGVIEDMGYHTVVLKESISLPENTRFAVIVKFTVPEEEVKVYCEKPILGESGKARANADESYVSPNGLEWTDLTEIDGYKNTNWCIKAFTDNGYTGDMMSLFSAINNDETVYESDKVYTAEEVIAAGKSVNEDYISYMKLQNETASLMSETDTSYGDVPSIVGMGGNTVSFADGAIMPVRYDLRAEGGVTEVRNQGMWSTCWAFASYASLESCLKKKEKSVDLSSMEDASSGDYISLINQYGIVPEKISLSDSQVMLAESSGYQLMASFEPLNVTERDVLWMSENEDVAVVDSNGYITAVSEGQTRIRCTSSASGVSAQCLVIVEAGDPVSSISLEYETVTVGRGDVFMADYTVNPTTAINKAVEWKSSNPVVVSINENGVMKANSIGTAEITVTSKDGAKSDSVTVVVNDGMNCEISGFTTDFNSYQGSMFGSVNADIKNRTSSEEEVTVMVAAYNNTGRMIAVGRISQVIQPGNTSLAFNNLFLENIAATGGSIKCFVWEGNNTMCPVSSKCVKEIEAE